VVHPAGGQAGIQGKEAIVRGKKKKRERGAAFFVAEKKRNDLIARKGTQKGRPRDPPQDYPPPKTKTRYHGEGKRKDPLTNNKGRDYTSKKTKGRGPVHSFPTGGGEGKGKQSLLPRNSLNDSNKKKKSKRGKGDIVSVA